MIVTKTIAADLGDAAATVHTAILKLTKGFVYQVGIYFPPGSGGLLRVRVRDYKTQLWPSDQAEWFFGDDVSFTWPESHSIDVEPYELAVQYQNLDEIYDHTMQLQIGFVTEEIFVGRFLPSIGAEQISEILQRYREAEQTLTAQAAQAAYEAAKAGLGIGS